MQFNPSLIVKRFRVERNAFVAYDEVFHSGVNIIRGENSSGKSTILNLLFFALGGDLKDWSETALLCSRVYVEVSLSGKIATLCREISDKRGQPMSVFAGDMDAALTAPIDHWERYPYARREQTASFSEILFSILGFPEVSAETAANVTMNQVLRLLYSDQLSPVDSIFKFEQFDPPAIREAAGRMLCGAFESEVYTNTLKIREHEKEFDQVVGELRSFFKILGRADQVPPLDLFAAEQASLLSERNRLVEQIGTIEASILASDDGSEASLSLQMEAYQQLQELQKALADAQGARDSILLEIADSSSFIADLERKREALEDTSAVADEIEHVRFHYCPSCHAPTGDTAGPHACHLCKVPFDVEKGKVRVVAMISDIDTQLKQSRLLQKRRQQELDRLNGVVATTVRNWEAAARRYGEAQQTPSSEARQRVNAVQRQLGYIDRQLEDFAEKIKVAQIVRDLTDRKDSLAASIAGLKSRNETLERSQQVNLANAFSSIADEIRALLVGDVSRQDSFADPKNIKFDFSDNKITVDDHTYFSASSRVILRNSFFVGFLTAAATHRYFRHPRFLMMDSIEDKGMEVERAQNFQRMIVSNVKKADSESQVIFGTSMIAPDLETDEYVVGRRSTRESRTLAIG